jgi:K+-transporting ATPase KdpF subunit
MTFIDMEVVMPVFEWTAAALAVGLLVYLVAALLRPDFMSTAAWLQLAVFLAVLGAGLAAGALDRRGDGRPPGPG